jgi:hypothetical protein
MISALADRGLSELEMNSNFIEIVRLIKTEGIFETGSLSVRFASVIEARCAKGGS